MIGSPAKRLVGIFVSVGLGFTAFSQVAHAKTSVITLATTTDRGNVVSIAAGTKWKSKSVVVELGVKTKNVWKWSRVATAKTDASGRATLCASKLVPSGAQLRLKSGSKIVATTKVSRAFQLSGCGFVPSQPSSGAIQSSPSSPSTTTTTTAPSTPAPTSLALSAATDTGDSSSDGITKATTLVIEGSAQAGSSVQVYVNGATSGSSCTANGQGAFSCTLGTVTEGSKSITAKATGPQGESVASQALTVVVDRTAPTITWNPLGNYWIGANDSMQMAVTISETTTNLVSGDIRLVCSIVGGCGIQNFSGSGRNYSFDFVTINNFANGGSVGFLANVFTDVAGNNNSQSNGSTVMFDTDGPRATVSRENGLFIVTFSEIPIGVTRHSFELIQYVNGVSIGGIGSAVGIDNFGTYGISGKQWRFTLSSSYQANNGMDYYMLEVKSHADVDGNNSLAAEISLP